MDVDGFDDGDIEEDDFQLLGDDDNPEFYDDYDSHAAAELADVKKKEKLGFVVLSKLELLSSIQKLSAEVTDSLNVSSEEAFLLLRFFNWEKEKLFDSWFADDPSKIALKAGVILDNIDEESHGPVDCPICFEEFSSEESYHLSCGHMYCDDCWKEYINNRFLSEQPEEFLRTKCPWPKCPSLCGNVAFKKFLTPQQYPQIEKYILDSYVERKNRHWCPSPFCSNAIETDTFDHKIPIECACKFRYWYSEKKDMIEFNFLCNDFGIGDHAPSDCDQVEKWLSKAAAESENLLWMRANTKKCPKCSSHIEKNGGCMHMTCNKCHHEFCWLCRGNWRSHSSCNKSEAVVNEEKQAKMAQNDLEHYMHYYHRYESHRNAMKIADEQRAKAEEKADFIMDRFGESIRSSDVKFIKEATETLIRCRNLLQYSYVYAYYMSTSRVRKAEKELFDHLQDNLEQQTNNLSAKYERDLEDIVDDGIMVFNKWKSEINNFINVCNKYMDNFIEGVMKNTLLAFEDGLTEDERFYYNQIKQLEAMGLERELVLPYLLKFDGNVDRVISTLFS